MGLGHASAPPELFACNKLLLKDSLQIATGTPMTPLGVSFTSPPKYTPSKPAMKGGLCLRTDGT